MKRSITCLIAAFVCVAISHAQKTVEPVSCDPATTTGMPYSKAVLLQAIMDSCTRQDLPGVAMAVYSDAEGWWAGASGYARLESKDSMTSCHSQYLQSISKTFMAVVILKLHEEGKIELDAPVIKYLPAKYVKVIRNAEIITVRMLLNHTSGIAEYNSMPGYTSEVILNPLKILSMDKIILMLNGREPKFAPGEHYSYTNTNYLLLAEIADRITGDHAKYLRQHILMKLGMNNTVYHPGNAVYKNVPDSYWDILSAGQPANITPMQKANVAPLKGDDGVVGTPVDAVIFLKGLMEGKLLHDSSMQMMKQWVSYDDGTPAYGLGLFHLDLNGIICYGHGGGGLGAGCLLLYVPSKKLYVFLATNTGVVVEGRGGVKANDFKDKILAALLVE
jgi:D-alanyl-D-alanine carboxypeptidase